MTVPAFVLACVWVSVSLTGGLATILNNMKVLSLSPLLIQCQSTLAIDNLPWDKRWCCNSEDGSYCDGEEQREGDPLLL
jgi:hypothetical protein